MKKLIIFLSLIICFDHAFVIAQTKDDEKSPFDLTRDQRIKKERIFGVYIPKDLEDAFKELDKKIEDPSKELLKSKTEDEVSNKLHYNFGRWMIINWSFYEGSRLTVYLNKLGIYHPDDMADFVLRTYYRYLTQKPTKYDDLIEKYKENTKKKLEEKQKKAIIISTQTKKQE
ncbi:MAG: hypothetical protein KBA06_06535 [Saprospiraceae bacterium]|nr:hypothetical protein [Saprospiraceae bacterium]